MSLNNIDPANLIQFQGKIYQGRGDCPFCQMLSPKEYSKARQKLRYIQNLQQKRAKSRQDSLKVKDQRNEKARKNYWLKKNTS